MEKLRAKLKNQGGFTLVEMLIVVAIIAILIAVSIPLVSNALEKTQHAADAANERAAKAVIMIQYMAGDDVNFDPTKVHYYNAATGGLEDGITNIVPYGQHKNNTVDHVANGIIAVKIDATTGKVTMQWTSAVLTGDPDNTGLCGTAKDVAHS